MGWLSEWFEARDERREDREKRRDERREDREDRIEARQTGRTERARIRAEARKETTASRQAGRAAVAEATGEDPAFGADDATEILGDVAGAAGAYVEGGGGKAGLGAALSTLSTLLGDDGDATTVGPTREASPALAWIQANALPLAGGAIVLGGAGYLLWTSGRRR